MKNKKILIILIIVIVFTTAAGIFFITRNLNKPNISDDTTFDFEEDTEIATNNLNEIFGENLSEEDKMFLTTTNASQTNNFVIKETDTNTVITSSIKIPNDKQIVNGNGQFEEPSPVVINKKTTPAKPAASYKAATSINYSSSSYAKPVRISSFILDYNMTKTASRANPLLVTIVTKALENARFLKIRVFARRLSQNNEILSRDMVFSLPKIYVVDGQSQTQFYFAGRTSAGKYLQKGRYLLYAEVEVVDANGKSVGKAGRYPLPKWDYIITLK